MKSIKFTFILAIFVGLGLISCENEPLTGNFSDETGIDSGNGSGSGNGAGSGVFTGSFQVKIDGELWVADNATASIVNGVTNITGFRGNSGEAVIITLQTDQVGSYQFGPVNGSVNGGAYNPGSGGNASVSDVNTLNGSVTISAIDTANKLISGSFSFNATDFMAGETKVLTEGVFTNISFSDDLGDSDSGNNSFYAKVDGVEFVEDLVVGSQMSLAGFESISITATRNTFETIGLNFPTDIVAGTYAFDSVPSVGATTAQYNLNQSTTGYIGDGSITITTHDIANKRIVGTFSFVGDQLVDTPGAPLTFTVTQGSFDVTYL